MALAQKYKFEMGNRKLAVSRAGESLKHQLREIDHKDVSNK